MCGLCHPLPLLPLLYRAVLEPVIVWAMGYLAYILADGFALSGIIRYCLCSFTFVSYVRTHARTQTVSHLQAEQSGGMRCSSQCQCGQTTLPYCCKPDRRQSPYTPMYVHVFLEIALPLSCWTTGHFDKCRSK